MLKKQPNNEELQFLNSLQNVQTIQKTPLKQILAFANANLQNKLFFSQLQTALETVLKQKLFKQEKEKVYQTLLKLNLQNNHLSNVLLYYDKLISNKISSANKFKLDQMLFEKMLMLFQYNKALTFSEQLLTNPVFKTLPFEEQRNLLLSHASILMLQQKTEMNFTFEHEKLNHLVETVNNIYFKIMKNTNSAKLKQYLLEFKAFSKDASNCEHIITNAYLNLPVVELLMKNNEIKTAKQILLSILNNPETTAHNRTKTLLMLLPILKNSNINELLTKLDELKPSLKELESEYFNIINNYTELVYENYSLKNSLKEKEEFLKTDSLTHCLSRNALEDVPFSFKNSYGAVVFFDLNNLKVINDTLGHPAGDHYLTEFANLLLPHTNEFVKAYRLGGDEFVLIADEHNEQQITKLLNAINKSAKKPIKVANKNIHLSYSVGVSLYPTNATSLNKLISLADKAMYRSKEEKSAGANKFYFSN